MRHQVLFIALSLPLAAYAGNIKDTDLITSNTFFLPPTTANTIYIQTRNSSDNQSVSLHDLGARLAAKGYQIVQDHTAAHYVLLANIVYCNMTKPELPVEALVAGGYGSGFGASMMSGLNSLAGMASMAGPQGAAVGMGLSAIGGIGSAVGNLFSGPSTPKMPDDVNYACVADVQITEQGTGPAALVRTGSTPQAGVYQTRLAASVHQKKMREEEATPLLQEKLSAAVAGNF
ncbi:MAG TPA: complement resistance protein TraT [Nitrospiraceae bacterium]|nr:complement resistance protein TraT [Nitrospiraceae bacterium]